MRALAAAVVCAALLTSAWAQEPTKDAAEEASIHRYGDTDKSCQEWTDSCRTCSRQTNGDPVCSNIGPACQPVAITCARRTEAPK